MSEATIELVRTLGLALGGGIIAAFSTLGGVIVTQRNGRKIAAASRRDATVRDAHIELVDAVHYGRAWIRAYSAVATTWVASTLDEAAKNGPANIAKIAEPGERMNRALLAARLRIANPDVRAALASAQEVTDTVVTAGGKLLPTARRPEGAALHELLLDFWKEMDGAKTVFDDLESTSSRLLAITIPEIGDMN